MKTFNELTPEQQTKAVGRATNRLLEAICEGAIRFNDKLNRDNLQKRIDKAWKEMERNRTPWFIGETIMETCRDDIEGMARCEAEDAIYSEPGEHVIANMVD